MSAGIYDIHAEQGTSFRFFMLYRDENKTPIDLSSFTSSMQVRKSQSSNDILLSLADAFVVGGGVTGSWTPGNTFTGVTGVGNISLNAGPTGAVTGGIYITIDETTMSNVPNGFHFYDFELKQGSIIDRPLQGRFVVDQEVTR